MIKKLSLLTQTHSQLYWQDGMTPAVYGSCFWCYLTVVTKRLSAQWFQFWRPFVQCSPHTPNLTSNLKENFENLSSSIKQTSVKALFWHTNHQGRTVMLFHIFHVKRASEESSWPSSHHVWTIVIHSARVSDKIQSPAFISFKTNSQRQDKVIQSWADLKLLLKLYLLLL